MHYTKKWEL